MTALAPAKPNKAALQREVVAASAWGLIQHRLPQIEDPRDSDFHITHRTYEQIACDPEASAALLLLVESVLADGVKLSPAVGEKDPQYQMAVDIKEHLERTFKGLPRDLDMTLKAILEEAMKHGNKVSRKLYKIPTDGPDANRLVLDRIRLRERKDIAFWVDDFKNLLWIEDSTGGMQQKLPPELFVIATFRQKDEDPRGRSIFRAVVKPWHLKQLSWPELLAFLMRCAVPGLVAILSDKAKDESKLDESGEPVVEDGVTVVESAAEVMLNELLKFKNSTALVAANGTTITPLEVKNKGEIFNLAFEHCNKEIRKGILLQELATADAEHQTKSSTGEQMSIVELLVWSIKMWAADIVRRQICCPQVEYNFGAQAARDLTPMVNCGDYDRRSWATDSVAVVALITATVMDENSNRVNALTPSQIQDLLKQIGLPPPTDEEIAAIRAKAAERQKQQEQQPGNDKQVDNQPAKKDQQQDEQKKAA